MLDAIIGRYTTKSVSDRDIMAELQDPKREESVFGTTDAPCNHACIGHGAGGLVSHPEFVDACLALVDRYHDKSRIGNFTFEWKGEVCSYPDHPI